MRTQVFEAIVEALRTAKQLGKQRNRSRRE
jgi:hypothetical protein